MEVTDLKQQVEKAVREYCKDINHPLTDSQINRVVSHMLKEYTLDELDQGELDDFLDSDAIGISIDFFSNDFLYEE
jgi:uncharacterized protein YpuA (DUF1002 family)